MSPVEQGRLAARLRRILVMLPYAIHHPGVSVDELAKKFGTSKHDLIEDLKLLFMCGLPGYGPGDLIDVSYETDRVYVRMADYFAAPLRLTPAEAIALYAGSAAIAALPEMAEADALRRALAKLGRALGATSQQDPGIEVQLAAGSVDHLKQLQRALAGAKQIRLEYMSASSGELTSRTVEPWGLVATVGHWYLIGWDHLRNDERMFRTDRIKSVEVLDAPATVPDDFDAAAYQGAFIGRTGQRSFTLEISPEAATWFEDYYPVTSSEELDDGWTRVHLQTTNPRWAAGMILQLGKEVRAISPASILDETRSLAASIAARYAPSGSDAGEGMAAGPAGGGRTEPDRARSR
ncbi:MAG: proteasome accessory factor [Actinomycetota bacterium]|nr:proteasome accessory factor [Actinomycetota bacterium]